VIVAVNGEVVIVETTDDVRNRCAPGRRGHAGARTGERYFVAGGGVVALGGVDGLTTGGGGVIGAGAVDGEADGTRSAGDSPTRSVDERLQAVSMPRPSARTQRPVAILFMCEPPPLEFAARVRGVTRDPARRAATPMPVAAALTGCMTTITNAVDSRRGSPKENAQ